MSTTINSTPNPTPHPPLQTSSSHPPENEKILSQPIPVAEMLEAVTEILESTEPEKPVAELKVVSSSQQSTSSLSETDDSDEDRDEEEKQLFIVEQVRPPSPDSTSSSQSSVDQHEPLYHVPFTRSPRPHLLGDRRYPIIIDADSATHETENETRNLCSPDEGYSSSTSPVDSRPHDFSSLLPFADYDEPSIPAEHLEKQRKGSNSEKTNRSGNPPEIYSIPKDTQMVLLF